MSSLGDIYRFVLITLSIVLVAMLGGVFWRRATGRALAPRPSYVAQPHPRTAAARFSDSFAGTSTIEETGTMTASLSPDWWLSSGGLMYIKNGSAQTVQGDLAADSKWRQKYAANNPTDTDNGRHPQNIFRLVTRSQFGQLNQEAYFRIESDELSASPQRNASNGLLFFNRYQDEDNLYYTGLRVDGTAVIKKKIHGTYYTMAEKAVYPGQYNHATSPNLLPKHTWIGLRSTVSTAVDGSVAVTLWSQQGGGAWQQLLEAHDDGRGFGGAPITAAGHGGVRTDFMDVSFRDYSISEL